MKNIRKIASAILVILACLNIFISCKDAPKPTTPEPPSPPPVDKRADIKHIIIAHGTHIGEEPINLKDGWYYFCGDENHVSPMLSAFIRSETNLTVTDIMWLSHGRNDRRLTDEMSTARYAASDLDITNGCFIYTQKRN